ncbi:hypothetical protein NLG97_g6682 [Lecanicillium saksenae]|uniref:Uncharacterized protein n=1 Tax=Lecanicillium saksenae TaxID=468837 RepID=A0ACC1QQT1_9HYPO|nr:hypothetical protein NLG97_g6682 [Lecanicillium saksenae]
MYGESFNKENNIVSMVVDVADEKGNLLCDVAELYLMEVGDAGADAALVVDTLEVSITVGRRGTLVVFRALFGIGASAASDGGWIPIHVRIGTMLVNGNLALRTLCDNKEGTEHGGGFDIHLGKLTQEMEGWKDGCVMKVSRFEANERMVTDINATGQNPRTR